MLRDLLQGLTPGRAQTVANMCVIPLMGPETEYKDVAGIKDISIERDTKYNSLHLKSNSEHVAIVPNGLTFITKQSAQDRTVPAAHLIKSRVKEVNVFCVQSSQAGHMRKSDTDHQIRLLPHHLRYQAFKIRAESSRSYDGLWNSLSEYNRMHNLTGDYLTAYFTKYQDQLEKFVAEFEIDVLQRGAIILINGEVAGIEVAPHQKAFRDIWEPMIRDCYGSEAVMAAKNAAPDESEIIEDVADLDDIVRAVEDAERREREFVRNIVERVLNQNESLEATEVEGNLELVEVDTEHYEGQAVRLLNDKSFVYASLMAKPIKNRQFAWN